MPLAIAARITGRYSGRAPAITALTATFSTVNSQNSRNAVGRRRPTTSSRARLVPASIASTRSSVGSTIGRKSVQRSATKRRWRFSSVSGSSSAGRRAIEGQAREVLVVERLGQPLDDELHERPAVDGVLAVDVGAQLAVGAPDDGLRARRPGAWSACRWRAPPSARGARRRACARPPSGPRSCSPETSRARRPSGYRCFRDPPPGRRRPRRPGSRRTSRGRRPSSRAAAMRLIVHARHVLGEPGVQLVDEGLGVVEQAVDEVERLALEALQARSERLAGDLRRIAARDRGR